MGFFSLLERAGASRLPWPWLFPWIEAVSAALDPQAGLTQATWFVDPILGNDNNDGSTAATALKTDARRQQLWGARTLITQPTTVTYASSPPATDPVNFDVTYATGGALTITGTPTVTRSNVALTAVTALNRGTQTPWDVTGVTFGAADVGRMMRINAGARAGNYCGVAKDLGGGKVRISPFGNLDFAGALSTSVCFLQATPQIGDTVDVISVPILPIGTMVFRAATQTVWTSAPTNCVVFDTIGLDGGSSGTVSMFGTVMVQGAMLFFRQATWQRLKFGGMGGIYVAGGIMTNTTQIQAGFSTNGGPFCQLLGFLMTAGSFTVQGGAACQIGSDCLFQNASLQTAGNCYMDFVSVFDRTVANIAVQVFTGGYLRSRPITAGDLLWGDGNTGTGVKVIAGGMLTYNTKPTINTPQGAGRQSLIGGVNTDWAGVPAVTAANNAAIVLEA